MIFIGVLVPKICKTFFLWRSFIYVHHVYEEEPRSIDHGLLLNNAICETPKLRQDLYPRKSVSIRHKSPLNIIFFFPAKMNDVYCLFQKKYISTSPLCIYIYTYIIFRTKNPFITYLPLIPVWSSVDVTLPAAPTSQETDIA